MNQKQEVALWVGIIIFVLMGLFPPCMSSYSDSAAYYFTGHCFIFDLYHYRVDVPHLLAGWAMVAVVTGGLIYTVRDKKPRAKVNMQKGFRKITIVLSVLISVLLFAVGAMMGVAGDEDWWLAFVYAFVSIAVLWIVYLIVFWVTPLIIGWLKKSFEYIPEKPTED